MTALAIANVSPHQHAAWGDVLALAVSGVGLAVLAFGVVITVASVRLARTPKKYVPGPALMVAGAAVLWLGIRLF